MNRPLPILPIPPVLPTLPILPVWIVLIVMAVAPFANAQERMSMIPADRMTDAQKKAVADYKALRGADLIGPPWSVLLRVPDQVVPALEIRLHYLNRSVLGPRLTELAILTAARKWTNNWEWNAHSTAAAAAGLHADIMAALADGRRPDRMAEDEALVYDVSLELQNNQSVSDATYARAVAKFGEPGVVELASIQGYYAYLALVMNVARITTQPGGASPLERYPRVGTK
jgi:4-carboxymuconolactone decarboxylase